MSLLEPIPMINGECHFIVAAAKRFAARDPVLGTEVGHIDNLPGTAVYMRDAEAIARILPKGARVLDWGCGFGQMSYLLANRGYRVSACDWALRPGIPELLDERIDYFSLNHQSSIGVANQSFDAVVSSGTLEHAQHILDSLYEIRRVLRPGGWFFVFRFPNELSISESVARKAGLWAHSVRMSKRELRFLLRMFSFRVEYLGYDSFLPIFFGRRLGGLRPLRATLDQQISWLDRLLTRFPLTAPYSTSIYAFGQLNTEYQDIISVEP